MIQEILVDSNLLGALVGAVAAYLCGILWYGPLFGSQWMKVVGKTSEQLSESGSMWPAMVVQALYTLALAVLVLVLTSTAGFGGALVLIVAIILAQIAGGMFERQPSAKWLISAGYDVLMVLIISAGICLL